MKIEGKLVQMGIILPDFSKVGYYGATFGSMKAHHRVGNLLFLSGHIPWQDGVPVYPGILGKDVTIEQGYQAARLTAINCLAGIKHAIGDLDGIVGIVRSLNFVVCTPDFYDVNKVSSGATDLFVEVLGEERGLGGRATIGVTSLASRCCFENWLTVEVQEAFVPDEAGNLASH
ncbi:MAG: RidA family protein [Dehalococcoidia bacterium]